MTLKHPRSELKGNRQQKNKNTLSDLPLWIQIVLWQSQWRSDRNPADNNSLSAESAVPTMPELGTVKQNMNVHFSWIKLKNKTNINSLKARH